MRAALILDDYVANVIEYDPEGDYSPESPYQIVPLEEGLSVGPRWGFVSGEFVEPASPVLEASLSAIPADAQTPSVITFTDPARASVGGRIRFSSSGMDVLEELDNGVARIEVVASEPGPILVHCEGLSLYITATEV